MFKTTTKYMTQDERRENLRSATEFLKRSVGGLAGLESIEEILGSFKTMREIEKIVTFWQLEVAHHEERLTA